MGQLKVMELMNLLLEGGMYQGCFPDPSKSLFVADFPNQEASTQQNFEAEGLTLNFVTGSRYLDPKKDSRYRLPVTKFSMSPSASKSCCVDAS